MPRRCPCRRHTVSSPCTLHRSRWLFHSRRPESFQLLRTWTTHVFAHCSWPKNQVKSCSGGKLQQALMCDMVTEPSLAICSHSCLAFVTRSPKFSLSCPSRLEEFCPNSARNPCSWWTFLRFLGIQPSVIVQGVVRHSQFYRFQLRIPLSLVTDIICVKAACGFEQHFCMSSFAQLSITEQVAEEARSKVAELKDFHSTCVSE